MSREGLSSAKSMPKLVPVRRVSGKAGPIVKAGGVPPSKLSCTLAGRGAAPAAAGGCHTMGLLLLVLAGHCAKAPDCRACVSGRSWAWAHATCRAAGQAVSDELPSRAAAAVATACAELLHCGARPV